MLPWNSAPDLLRWELMNWRLAKDERKSNLLPNGGTCVPTLTIVTLPNVTTAAGDIKMILYDGTND